MTTNAKKKDGWMDFYNGKLPRKLIRRPAKRERPAKGEIVTCPYCSNKSNEGSGLLVDGIWVCSPCIVKHDLSSDVKNNDNGNDGFKKLDPWEIKTHEQREKNRNFWLMVFGAVCIAIILSLVERSRIFSVIAVVALVAVYLLYRYEVK